MKSIFAAITNASVRFRWITVLFVALCLALGVFSAARMRQELLPPIDFPQVFVLTVQPGASSEDLRDLVSVPLEQAVSGIPGVVNAGLQSTTAAPISFVSVAYEYGLKGTTVQSEIQAAIDSVVSAGVPKGLKTTADLTPSIVTRVLKRAPSMWAHFDSAQLLALPPDVLDAALSVNPDFVAQLDPLTSEQLAAERLNQKLTGKATAHAPAPLPNAWIVTDNSVPTIKTFSVNSLPIVIASVAATSPDLTADQLRALVNSQIVDPLTKQHTIPGVADVSVDGGQQIPADVAQEAASAVARIQAQQAPPASSANNASTGTTPSAPTPAPTASPAQSTPNTTPANTPQIDANGVPLLPQSWSNFVAVPLLNSALHVPLTTPLTTAADLLKTKDSSGATQSAAAALNVLAASHDGNFIRDLSPSVLTYLQKNEAGFIDNLSPLALAALSEDAYVALKGGAPAPALGDAWTPLLEQPAFQNALVPLATVRDLLVMPNGAAGTINEIVADTPSLLQRAAIQIVSSLTPDAIAYLSAHENGFLSSLSPAVLRYLSADALKSLPSGFIDKLADAQLKTDLKAIIADPSKAAAASLTSGSASVVPDDPNAPPMPDSWPKMLGPFGIKAVKADDLLRHPSGQPTAAAFINLLANRNATQLIADLTPSVLAYLQAHEPTFYADLQPSTLTMLSKATLNKLPPQIAERASSGTAFTPTNTVTRVNSESSLILTITKDDSANTVEVADAVQSLFAQLQKTNPQLTISVPFEQAGFIKDSINGVAREGVLGAIMAVLVILLFLNFSFRSTFVTAVSIPTSVAIAFVLMYEVPRRIHPLLAQLPDGTISTLLLRLFPANITLNIMTLSGLTVAIGRVVDDSIVVLENIYRQVQTGVQPKDAVLRGVRDVSLAIFAATVTTIVVFLPIGLSGGLIGEVFLPFGLAVTYALAASFLVAITIVPVLAYWFVKQPKTLAEEGKEGRLQAVYHRTIIWALNHRWLVLGLAGLSLVVGMVLFATRPTTFLPAFGQPQITAGVSMPSGTPLAQTNVYVEQFESYLHTLVGTGDKGIDRYQTDIGSSGGFASFVGGAGVSGNAAQITIVPSSQDADTITALTLQIRTKAETIFGKDNVKVSKGSLTDSGFGGFALVISGSEVELKQINDAVIKTLDGVPGLVNVTSTLSQVAGAGTTYLRVAGQPAVQFGAELETQDTLGVTAKAIAAVKAMPGLPSDLTVGEGFQSQQQTQGFSQMFGSLALAILIVYLVMVFTFGSPVHPFTILFSLPLAVVGAAAALAITNRVVGISALIGLLMLVGIVVTNAIVLVDRVQSNRKERHLSAREALIEAGRTRLRPILMTAIATMIALLPLASGLSEGAIIAAELGTVVIGGLFSSTVLTLIVVPVVYSLLDQAQRVILRRPAERAEGVAVKEAASAD